METFKQIKTMMIQDGKLEIVSCGSGSGKAGAQLLAELESIFGAGNVKLYNTSVTWNWKGTVNVGGSDGKVSKPFPP